MRKFATISVIVLGCLSLASLIERLSDVPSVSGQACGIKQGAGGQILQCGSGNGTGYYIATLPVPYQMAAASGFGYNDLGDSEADIYTLTNAGSSDPAIAFRSPNLSGAFQTLAIIDNAGDISPQGNLKLATSGTGLVGLGTQQAILDDGSGHGWSYTATMGATYGHTFNIGSTLLWRMDPSDNLINANGTLLPSTASGNTGFSGGGNVVGSNGPTLVNPIVGTQTTGDNTTKAASTAFVQNTLTAISSGVVSINGSGGAFTFTGAVSCTATTCNFTSAGVADVNATVPVQTNLAAGACNPASPNTPYQTAMTGLTSAMGVWPTWAGDTRGTAGWNPGTGTMNIKAWPDAAGGLVDWAVCNYNPNPLSSAPITIRFVAQ